MIAPAMDDFEFLFALYGLMLGLSVAEVLSGLARSIEERLQSRPTLRIGWLCPLLAAFVLLDLLSFWGAAWMVRRYTASGWGPTTPSVRSPRTHSGTMPPMRKGAWP